MSYFRREVMHSRDYRVALSDPNNFVLSHFKRSKVPLVHAAEHTGIPYRTILNYTRGRRVGLSAVRLTALIQYVLWLKGEPDFKHGVRSPLQ